MRFTEDNVPTEVWYEDDARCASNESRTAGLIRSDFAYVLLSIGERIKPLWLKN